MSQRPDDADTADLEEDRLDDLFHALANRTRRALMRDLEAGPARVNELARPHGMSVAAISKHLFVLERAGLIRRARDGAIQSCILEAGPMASAERWIGHYRHWWSGQLDRLQTFVEQRPGGTTATLASSSQPSPPRRKPPRHRKS